MKINKKLLLGAALGFAFMNLNSQAFATAQYDVIKQSLKTRGIKNPTDEDAKVFAATDPTQRKALLDKWLAAQKAGAEAEEIRAATAGKKGAEAIKAVDDLAKGDAAPKPDAGAAPKADAGAGAAPKAGAGAAPKADAGAAPEAAKVYTAAMLKTEVGVGAGELTDEALEDDVKFMNTLTAAEQKALVEKYKFEVKEFRKLVPELDAADQPNALSLVWDENISYESWLLYKAQNAGTFKDFMVNSTGGDLAAQMATILGLKRDATDAQIQMAYTAFVADLNAKGDANAKILRKYYDGLLKAIGMIKEAYEGAKEAGQ